MKRNVSLVLALVVIAAMAIASCGQPKEKSGPTEGAGPTTPGLPQTSAAPASASVAANPTYGGSITIAITADYSFFDPVLHQAITCGHMQYTSNELMQGDWMKGPAGTKETEWEAGFVGRIDLETGELADSWAMPDGETIIFNIHKGAKFQNKPPANGREVTAQDVAWNIQTQFDSPGAWQAIAYPKGDPKRPTSIKALDKYTVEIKVPATSQAIMVLEIGDNLYTNPPEIWTSGGNMNDWRSVVGTGPFMLTDYVTGSSVTYVKNPLYFEKDPARTQNQVPYLDSLRQLIIPDLSSRLAAVRTGKIDLVRSLVSDDARQLLSTQKNLQYKRYLFAGSGPAMRTDKPPFNNLKVRQAMNMAVDKKAILEKYYDGDAVIFGFPFLPTETYKPYFTPLDQEPPEVQMLYTYDPTKAKQLLKDAGYPNGFKTNIICIQDNVDLLSIVKNDLAAIGVDMSIDVKETGVWTSIRLNQQWEGMYYGGAPVWAPQEQLTVKAGMKENLGFINDPYYVKVAEVIGRDMVKDPANYQKTMKESGTYELASAWGIWSPNPYVYNVWWPWVRDYHGENWTGWAGQNDWYKYLWLDQSLKKSMGY